MTEPQDRARGGSDEDLRALLRAGDPAGRLPPLPTATTARLLEDAMTESPATPEHAERTEHPQRRSPLTWLVAAAAVVVLGGTAWAGIGLVGDDVPEPGSAAPPASSPTTDDAAPGGGDASDAPQQVTALALPTEASARCMVPTARVLAGQDVAFQGRVTAMTEDVVTLETDRWFAGEPTEVVEVEAVDPTLEKLILGPEFRTGSTYLVSATGGRVSLCGLSAVASPQLLSLYEQAFE